LTILPPDLMQPSLPNASAVTDLHDRLLRTSGWPSSEPAPRD
jgi:hypothetical protein